MVEQAEFGLSVLLRYGLLPAALLALVTAWGLRSAVRLPWARPATDRAIWGLIAAFGVIHGLMASLRYLAYRTTIQDLGFYDQRIWALSITTGLPSLSGVIATLGHFSPVLALHALAYRVCPSALVLLWLQVVAVGLGAYPVYCLARRHLGPGPALAFGAAYLLYPSVAFTVLFDFHPDHLLVPLLLLAFDLLDRGRWWSVAAVSAAMLLVKESLAVTVVAFGAYAVLVTGRYLVGAAVAVGGLVFLLAVLLPASGALFSAGASGSISYGYLGADVPSIVRTLLLSPGAWLPELFQVAKMKFVFLMLAPLAFLPLLGPSALLVAVPGLLMSLLSREPHRYQIWAQYTAPIIAPLFAAAIFGAARLVRAPAPRWLPAGADLRGLVSLWVLAASLYGNVVFSPSPASTVFWLGTPGWLSWSYHAGAYAVGPREREIRRALAAHVPSDPAVSVSSQNSVNSSHLAHRRGFIQFPGDAAFVVVDLRRPPYVWDRVDPAGFSREIDRFRASRPIVYEADGFVIFGPAPR